MRFSTEQTGFSAVELVIVLCVVGVLGVVGYGVYNRHSSNTAASTASGSSLTSLNQSPTATDIAAAPQITTASDLNKALSTVNQTNPSGTNNNDAGQLDSQLASF